MPSKVLNTLVSNDKSFSNNFKIDSYDRETNSTPILDIWKDIVYVLKQEEKVGVFNFLYHEVKVTDSLESLAENYYNDQRLWWLILLANDSEDPFDFINVTLQNGNSIKIYRPELVAKLITNNSSNDIIKYLKGN
jgi:hypothetical protein